MSTIVNANDVQEQFPNLLTRIDNGEEFIIAKAGKPIARLVPIDENEKWINLQSKGITKEDAQDLKNRLTSFGDDWNSPGMELYDKL